MHMCSYFGLLSTTLGARIGRLNDVQFYGYVF